MRSGAGSPLAAGNDGCGLALRLTSTLRLTLTLRLTWAPRLVLPPRLI